MKRKAYALTSEGEVVILNLDATEKLDLVPEVGTKTPPKYRIISEYVYAKKNPYKN
jgi:hypothetical protein